MRRSKSSLWWRDSNKPASGKTGAVHYQLHQGKLELALKHEKHRALSPLETYLKAMTTDCPHRFFQKEGRGSKLKAYFDRDGVSIRERQNLAIRMAQFAVQSARHNRQRHDVVQKFMIANDAVTVAAEVPVYLFPKDIQHFKSKLGFDLPFDDNQTLTGHIDALQVRGGAVHVLDY